MDRRGETIVSRSDHHGINGIHPRPSAVATLYSHMHTFFGLGRKHTCLAGRPEQQARTPLKWAKACGAAKRLALRLRRDPVRLGLDYLQFHIFRPSLPPKFARDFAG